MTRAPKPTKPPKRTPVADALRRAGFVPTPRLWVTEDQLDVIMRMARGNEHVVNDIRGLVNEQERERVMLENRSRRSKEQEP